MERLFCQQNLTYANRFVVEIKIPCSLPLVSGVIYSVSITTEYVPPVNGILYPKTPGLHQFQVQALDDTRQISASQSQFVFVYPEGF